ncbi:hypothetical protein C8R45DRAFT_933732 [Mycena sanguinolenta]|nr:hypothetical protein C8R45DRAFT_933732 [Mycena sanguinolenta]
MREEVRPETDTIPLRPRVEEGGTTIGSWQAAKQGAQIFQQFQGLDGQWNFEFLRVVAKNPVLAAERAQREKCARIRVWKEISNAKARAHLGFQYRERNPIQVGPEWDLMGEVPPSLVSVHHYKHGAVFFDRSGFAAPGFAYNVISCISRPLPRQYQPHQKGTPRAGVARFPRCHDAVSVLSPSSALVLRLRLTAKSSTLT